MRGDTVLARAFGGEPLRRIAWGEADSSILIVHPDHYERALRGEVIYPIGFPVEDVFTFDVGLYEQLKKSLNDGPDVIAKLWRQARPYKHG